MKPFLQFALSQPISNVVIGCDSIEQLEQNAEFARSFVPLSGEEQASLVAAMKPYARELMLYKP